MQPVTASPVRSATNMPLDQMTNQHHPLTDQAGYDQALGDCWAYLYYELGMKDLADEMHDWVSAQRKPQSTQENS